MNIKAVNAIDRLNRVLPLVQRQQNLGNELADVYQNILYSYVERGRSLNRDEISRRVGNIDECINTLKENDMIVLDSNGEVTGAYPFTMEQRAHEVTVNGHKVHCMCALDALAVSPMFGLKAVINSSCHATSEPVSIHQHKLEILNIDNNNDVFFGINWNSSTNNCCATSLCTEMIFLKGKQVAEQWQEINGDDCEIFDLRDAVDFASGFFSPLIKELAA